MNKELNKSELGKVAHKNATSEAVFNVLAIRERNREETDLRRLRNQLVEEGFKIVPEEFKDTFQALAKAGVGELVAAHNGHPARFKWHFSLIEVGQAGLQTKPAEVKPLKVVAPIKAKPTEAHIMITLANGRSVQVSLPTDLSQEEASLVSKFILQRGA